MTICGLWLQLLRGNGNGERKRGANPAHPVPRHPFIGIHALIAGILLVGEQRPVSSRCPVRRFAFGSGERAARGSLSKGFWISTPKRAQNASKISVRNSTGDHFGEKFYRSWLALRDRFGAELSRRGRNLSHRRVLSRACPCSGVTTDVQSLASNPLDPRNDRVFEDVIDHQDLNTRTVALLRSVSQ